MAGCYVIDLNGLYAGSVSQSLVVDPSGCIVYGAGQTTDMLIYLGRPKLVQGVIFD